MLAGRAASGKGMQVMNFRPDGKVLTGAGQRRPRRQGLDLFEARIGGGRIQGRCLRRRRPCTDFGNSLIMKFDKNGKFIMTFGRVGSADGEFQGVLM